MSITDVEYKYGLKQSLTWSTMTVCCVLGGIGLGLLCAR